MKTSTTLLFCLGFFLVGCNSSSEKDKYAPNDHFYFQRSFPSPNLDYAAMEKTLKTARVFTQDGLSKDQDTEWIQEGPYNIGGRINCIAIHPENENTILCGTAGGGVYRTNDGGDTWSPITDDLSHLPIGDVVFDPTDPNTIYVGTGDVNIGGTVHIGNGIYKSVDSGETWEYLGLSESRIISKIAINPEDPTEIFVGTMGVPFERNEDRGLYRTNDGGETWTQVLYISDDSGIIDLVMNPENPDVLYTANWNRIRTNLESEVSGPDAGIYKTEDGGETWTLLTNGLPSGDLSRIGLQLWEGDPDKVFVVVVDADSNLGGVYKSDDAGESFETLNISEEMLGMYSGFGWYFAKIAINPADEDEISILGVDLYTTQDGGDNWVMSAPEWWTYEVHADKHDLEYTPSGNILLATDGGLYKCAGDFENWEDIDDIPNTQFYRVAADPFQEGLIYGGAQDNGTNRNSLGIPEEWERVFGGDGFTPIPDHTNPSYLYFTTQRGNFYFYDFEFEIFIELSESLPSDLRTNWDSPIVMDPNDHTVLYTGRDRIFKMENAPFGVWDEISDALVDPSDEFYDRRNVSTIGQSAINSDLLYAGTSDGKVWRTLNDGENWQEITEGLPTFYVTSISASPENENEVTVTLSGYRENDDTPHIYRSFDNGTTWESIAGDLPIMPINDVIHFSQDVFFIATDNGVYYTENDGENWLRAGNNMPFIVVLDLAVDELSNRLIAGTFAQSIYSIDLEELLEETDGIAEIERIDVTVYPNPSSDRLQVNMEVIEDLNWQIFDLQGRIVQDGMWQNGSTPVLSIQSLDPATYLISCRGKSVVYTSTFVVSR